MLAIIPARKGSKKIKNKNRRLINRKPLISYTIEAALKSKYISQLLVSSDDKEIIKIASQYNIDTPFLRPKKISLDKSEMKQVIIYNIEKLTKLKKKKIHEVILLQPTSPLRTSKDIDLAIKLFKKNKADSVIAVKKVDIPHKWLLNLGKKNKLKLKNSNLNMSTNRQSYETLYIPNGSIFIFNYNFLKKSKNYYGKRTYGYIMPKVKSFDIDDQTDFQIEEGFLKKNYEK